MRLAIETGGPARIEVHGPDHQLHQPEGALMDRTARNRPGQPPDYLGHFVSSGSAALELPAGRYTVIVEKGLEFERLETTVDLEAARTLRLLPKRWTHMAGRNWWSADFHLHRPLEDAPLLLRAEDLNLGVFFTMWNKRNLWEGKPLPADPVVRADASHLATVMNAEDERGGGAWMMHNLKHPLALAVDGRWYPQGGVFVEQAKAQGAWFDCEKPIWWETPVMAAITRIDSLGVLHNHYNQYGMNANEAWGRPRDQKRYPGNEGFSNYSLSLYYRYLNLGQRLPASAGSASGVLPAPPGYNRIYVPLPGGLSVDDFYRQLRAGRGFVTNGPMLSFAVEGKVPGDTLTIAAPRPLRVAASAQSREPIDRIQILANGRVVAEKAGARLEAAIDPGNYTWLAARCYLRPGLTVRLAHSSPIYLRGGAQRWDASADAAWFLEWIDDLIAESESDPRRFRNSDEKSQVLAIYRRARAYYARLARA
ncbi:MAG TPA: CehA/McbA family metallohydrolase [Bryobacteraceae bacterium]|nr:CehA/McbA family metallohydrolase [Bryobacteraceae bacterium]